MLRTTSAVEATRTAKLSLLCSHCGKINHFAVMCRSIAAKRSTAVGQKRRRRTKASHHTAIGCLKAKVNVVKAWVQPYTTLHIGYDNVPIKFKVDTGAEVNLLPITESRTKQLNPARPGWSTDFDLTRQRPKSFVRCHHHKTTRDELEKILGMITYLEKFAPNWSVITATLRDLTKKENKFVWDAVREKAYTDKNQLLCK